MRLTLRTLLAYLDDTLTPVEAREIGLKLAENEQAQELADKIKRVTRRRGLATPPVSGAGTPSDPNTVAEYLSDTLPADQVAGFEKTCLESDVHLAEVAACHQILTLVLTEQVRVPPTARRRMYQLVKGRESMPDRKPGKAIPIGGVIEDEKPHGSDDADAGLLLGLPAYEEDEPSSRRAIRIGAVVVLLVGFAIALWMAIPPGEPVAPEPKPVALTGQPEPEKVRPLPAPPDSKAEPLIVPPQPAGQPLTSAADPPETTPVESGKKDLVPAISAPRPERVSLGRIDPPAAGFNPIVVRMPPGAEDGWSRVMPDEPGVISTERLMALPGYKTPVRFESGVTIDLWGNLPDLVPAPLLGASITPWLPGDGHDADVTVHSGRIYLSTTKPAGATIRLRFNDEVWEVTLGDEKSEVLFELTRVLTPGAIQEPALSAAALAVLNGRAIVKLRHGQPRTLVKGDDVFWDSKGGKPAFRMNPVLDANQRSARAAYLSKVPTFVDAGRASALLQALGDFSRSLTASGRVRAAFSEALQEKPPTELTHAAARIAVFTFAALVDLPALADAMNDPNRALIRQTAAEGLRFAFASDPDVPNQFRQVLVEKSRVGDEAADSIIRLVHGFTDAERGRPETMDRLVASLESASIAVRELSFLNLTGFIDVQEKSNQDLLRFDAGAPVEFRTPVITAWRKKIEDVKKKPLVEQAPPPMKK